MKNTLFIIFLGLSLSFFAQDKEISDTLTIKIKPIVSNRVVLYSAEGATQKYVNYTDSETGIFKLAIPKSSRKGMYRLVFNQETMDYIDFIYANKAFEMQFDPSKPEQSPVFVGSPENTQYFSGADIIGTKQQLLDSLQVVYFQETDPFKLKNIEKKYQNTKNELSDYLNLFNQSENSLLVKDFIKANSRVLPQSPIKIPEEYLPYIKEHYFDKIDFTNENLIHSSILIDKVMDYVFYLTLSRDKNTQNDLYKTAINTVLQKIENQNIKLGFLKAFIQSFTKEENIVLVDYLFENQYNKLDPAIQNTNYKKTITTKLVTAIGRTAPDFTWEENGKTQQLSKLKDYDYYLVVFWSSTCPHCLKELPKLYEYIKDNKKVKVIAIGLETEESKGKWKSETYYYPNFTHILGLGKWENPIARSFNVFSTPDFYILDADKKIVNKPYEVVDLKVFFKGVKSGK